MANNFQRESKENLLEGGAAKQEEEEKCCCFTLDKGMRWISGFFLIHGLLNLFVWGVNLFGRGAPMAWGDFLMVPQQIYLFWVMLDCFKNDEKAKREKITKLIMIVNIINTIVLALCVLWMAVDFKSAFPYPSDFDDMSKEE